MDAVASHYLNYEGSPEPIKVSLLPNPSHLGRFPLLHLTTQFKPSPTEAVNPVTLGKTRAKQYSLLKTSPNDCKLGDRVMCVQLHGDASFAGQGIIMESLGLSNLPHYTTGGTVHIVVKYALFPLIWSLREYLTYVLVTGGISRNLPECWLNTGISIGYTTPAAGARSSLYSSDIGKMINAPVLHVNGDHPEGKITFQGQSLSLRSRLTSLRSTMTALYLHLRCCSSNRGRICVQKPLQERRNRGLDHVSPLVGGSRCS